MTAAEEARQACDDTNHAVHGFLHALGMQHTLSTLEDLHERSQRQQEGLVHEYGHLKRFRSRQQVHSASIGLDIVIRWCRSQRVSGLTDSCVPHVPAIAGEHLHDLECDAQRTYIIGLSAESSCSNAARCACREQGNREQQVRMLREKSYEHAWEWPHAARSWHLRQKHCMVDAMSILLS